MFISNSGLRKAKFRSTADNSLGVSSLAPFSVFKVDGGENLVPEPKIVDVSFITNYDTLQIENNYAYGSKVTANLLEIYKIIIESEQEIQLTDYIEVYGIPELYGYPSFGSIGRIQDYLEYINFITPNKIDITSLFINLYNFIMPEFASFYLCTSDNYESTYEITQTITGRTKFEDSITVDVNDENVTIDWSSLDEEEFKYLPVTYLSDEIQLLDLYHEQTLNVTIEPEKIYVLGVYTEEYNDIEIFSDINADTGLIINDNSITIPEGFLGDSGNVPYYGFYCIFNLNLSDDGTTLTSINLVPSSYIIQETLINENSYYFETEGEHEVEFEYVNKFYSDLVYPRTNDYFSDSCIIELNDNFYDYRYTTINEDKIEKVSLSNNVPESVVDSIISPSFNKFKEINVNTDKYITINNCVIDRDTFDLVTLGGGDITVPSFVKSYSGPWFSHNKYLTSIKFLNNYNVTECPSFWRCENLKYVTLSNSMKIDLVDSYNDNKFDYCPNIEEFNGKYASDDKKLLIVNNVIISAAGDEHINIPNTVNRIGVASFRGRTNLKSITIPDSVTSVGDWAVSDCTALTAINIPSEESIYKIDYGIYNLTDRYKNNVNFYVNDNLINFNNDIIIPDSVTSIGKGVFYNNKNLTSINIPDSVTSIGDYAFCGCSGLTSITIPDSVTSIGSRAFDECSGLTSVNISSLDSWLNIYFYNEDANPIYAARNLYLNGQLVTDLVIPDYITEIKQYAFRACSNLNSVTIGNGVTSIGYNAFSGCSNLNSVTIGNGVTSIDIDSFASCSNLTSVNISSLESWFNINFKNSHSNPLRNAKNLYLNNELITDLVIPDSVITIGNYALYNCSNLTSITIPDSVTSIGNYAFDGCESLTSITIPDSVTSIGNYAFSGCSNLTSVNIPNGVMSIGNFAFIGCSGLTLITLPDSVTSIGSSTFYDCTGLTSVNIPDSVTSIENYTFSGCSNLTSINIPDSVTSIGSHAFRNCSNLAEIICHDMTAPTIAANTFYNVKTGGVLKVPTGATGYDAWLSKSNYYLGKYGWTIQYI